jgi:hypothetical protein
VFTRRNAVFRDLESGIRNLKRESESISRQLGAWIRALRDSEKQGQRYVSDKARRAEKAAKDRKEFLVELERIRTGAQEPSEQSPTER